MMIDMTFLTFFELEFLLKGQQWTNYVTAVRLILNLLIGFKNSYSLTKYLIFIVIRIQY